MTKPRFFNTKSRKLEELHNHPGEEIKIYTCGPTVYNSLHIGNWLAYVRWDTLVRLLNQNGYKTMRVTNITDVGHLVSDGDEGEDKLEVGAKRENLSAYQVAKRYEAEFYEGVKALGLLPADKYARATDYISQQIELIKKLDANGFTYKIDDGVYFDTSKFPRYPDFAKLDLKGQESGARVEINSQKRQPWDFALWKFSPKETKRDMEWESPWGKGFPGWHLECSAIAMDILGETLDIHTGGIDHIPVHHTNEIAQSEAATGKPFSKLWLHNNFLLINDTKLSKSLDNGLTLKDLEEKGYSPLDFKMLVLQSHYRSEASFSFESMDAAAARLRELRAFSVLIHQSHPKAELLPEGYFEQQTKLIVDALNDDMNTPVALSLLSETIEKVLGHGTVADSDKEALIKFIEFLDSVFGFNLAGLPDISDEHKADIKRRSEARDNKSFEESDTIRRDLEDSGILLSDGTLSTTWHYK